MHMIPPPPVGPIEREVDTECYVNYWLCKLRDHARGTLYKVELHEGQSMAGTRSAALRTLLSGCTIITYNGNKYDLLMISAALSGNFDCALLKRLSDYIIQTRPAPWPWEVAREWGFEIIRDVDHIDLMEVVPGDKERVSLKTYGARLHTRKLQDLPYDITLALDTEQKRNTDEYCGNDLTVTSELYDAVAEDIETRRDLSEQYGIDLRSKSDAQIAEAAIRKLFGLDYQAARKLIADAQRPIGFQFHYKHAPFLRFQTQEMQGVLKRVLATRFTLTPTMQIEAQGLDDFELGFHGGVYRMGVGGLHSSEKSTYHRAGPDCVLTDFDVASYYPRIIDILGLFPPQLGPRFLEIYRGWIATRLEHKRAKRKKKANTFKIKLNGTFGKTKEHRSVMFSPEMFIQIVITGQLSLLMLIERMALAGVQCVSANTDGIVLKCHPSQVEARNAVIKQWEADTGFEMEGTDYLGLFSRDVNAYMAFKPDGEVKTKGPYADDPISRLAKNPSASICVDAVKAFIMHGTPLEQTIRRCADIRKFVVVKNVQGGGSWVRETVDATRVSEKRALLMANNWQSTPDKKWFDVDDPHTVLTLDQATRVVLNRTPREYLGKVVRWYYGVGQRGHIAAKRGAMVGESQGCKPCMELPAVLPPDINYSVYVTRANNILKDLGVGY